MRYFSSLSIVCFSIPTASRECLPGFLSQVILAFLDLTLAYRELHSSSLCLPECHCQQLPDPLQPVECLKHPNLCFRALLLWPAFCIFLCLFSDDICAHLCDILEGSQTPYNIQSFYVHHTIFCWLYFHSWSIPYVHVHILKVCHVWFSLCWTPKWAISRHAIQTSRGISQLSLSLLAPFFSMYSF